MTTDLDRLVVLSPGPDGDAPPLFCVHSSSGSAYSYLGLAGLLGNDRPVYGIEAPGFDGDREPVRSLPRLSAEYVRTLRQFRPAGDVLLLGWSLGGIIAFDMARRLTETGTRVRRVVMIDVSMPRIAPLPPEREIARRFLAEILASLDTAANALDAGVARLPPDATADAVFHAAERSGVLPAELDAELLAERYAVFRGLVEASYRFEVTGRYQGPVTQVIASESAGGSGPLPPYLRWDEAASDLTVHTVPGSHHSIWTGDRLPRLAELVRTAVDDSN